MTTNELKVSLFLENGMKKPIFEFFDPLLFLKASPVILSEQFIAVILGFYVEKSRSLNILDIYFLRKLHIESTVKNIVLESLFANKEVSRKLTLFDTLYTENEFNNLSGAEYFERFPDGRAATTF